MKNFLIVSLFLSLSFLGFSQGITLSLSATSPKCYGSCDGVITASVTGAVGPISYNWSNGVVGSSTISACAGIYSCAVSDGSSFATQNINVSEPILLAGNTGNSNLCNGYNAMICPIASGGTPPYSYSISPSIPSCTTFTVNNDTYYLVTVFDSNGCSSTDTSYVHIVNSHVESNPVSFPSCGQSNGAVSFSLMPGSSPYMDIATSTQTYTNTSFLYNVPSDTYTITAYDYNGCPVEGTYSFPDSCDLVWPGDANDDLISNNLDILSIGIGNGTSGTNRYLANINWQGNPSANWGQTMLSGSNYKHIDTDGNGTINLNDTVAVIQNFNLTRPASKVSTSTILTGIPDLHLLPFNDTIISGNSSKMSIMLGNSTNSLSNIYGIAFTISYDNAIIDGNSFGLNANGSWMGTQNSNLIAVGLKNVTNNQYQSSIVRVNQSNISGNGKIGEISFKSLSNLSSNISTTFTLSNITLIDYSQNVINVNPTNTNFYVKTSVTGLNELKNLDFKIYPNPAKDQVNVELADNSQYVLEFYDLLGKKITTHSFTGKNNIIDVSSFSKGVYFVKINKQGIIIATKKLIID